MENWEIEFDKFRNFDGCEYGHDFHHRIKEFIRPLLSQTIMETEVKYGLGAFKICKEEIDKAVSQAIKDERERMLGLECMKEEEVCPPSDGLGSGCSFCKDNQIRNKLRLELKHQLEVEE